MVGSDERHAPFGVDGGYDGSDALIDGFDGSNNRRKHAGMPNHVRIGKIDDDDVVVVDVGFDGPGDLLSRLGKADHGGGKGSLLRGRAEPSRRRALGIAVDDQDLQAP